jgi:MinD-like ATPase involved in chromosome partitioning or flagellar assembly
MKTVLKKDMLKMVCRNWGSANSCRTIALINQIEKPSVNIVFNRINQEKSIREKIVEFGQQMRQCIKGVYYTPFTPLQAV